VWILSSLDQHHYSSSGILFQKQNLSAVHKNLHSQNPADWKEELVDCFLLLFVKKKALFRCAEAFSLRKPRPGCLAAFPQENNWSTDVLLFLEKKQKALLRFAEAYSSPKTRRSRPRGFGGLPPQAIDRANAKGTRLFQTRQWGCRPAAEV
jgi:hypothetical protein